MPDEPITDFEINQHKVALAVHSLMDATIHLCILSQDRTLKSLVQGESGGIEAAHAHISRMLERIR